MSPNKLSFYSISSLQNGRLYYVSTIQVTLLAWFLLYNIMYRHETQFMKIDKLDVLYGNDCLFNIIYFL